MPGPDPVTLRYGTGGWLGVSHALIVLAGLAAILLSPAGWAWKASSVLALIFAAAGLYFSSTRPKRRGTVRLLPDGTAKMWPLLGRPVTGILKSNAWASRWLSVVPIYDAERRKNHYCVVSAFANRRDVYRRLLVILRMGSSSIITEKNSWI